MAFGTLLTFVIRAELLKHYNEREPAGLKLGLFMTFFFSYLYFQYHLYKIALAKKQQHTISDLESNNELTS